MVDMIVGLLFSLLCFAILLIKSSDFIIVAVRRISAKTKTGTFIISALILALGTSLPEMFVGITSALDGLPNLSLGVVIGSNIANITLVAGLGALLFGSVEVRGMELKKEMWYAFIAGFLPIFLLLDLSLSRVDGLILIAAYGAYASNFFRERFKEIAKEHQKENFVYRFMRTFVNGENGITRELARLFIGIGLLLFSADMIVKISKILAISINIPVFVIGLLVLAVGTSLPEVAFSLRTLGDKHPSMFFGNLLGSTIVNSTLIVGIVSVISPITVKSIDEYLVATIVYLVTMLLFVLFSRSKSLLTRKEALVLVGLYIIFIILEIRL